MPVLDAAMLQHDPLNYHPLVNDRTTAISAADLLRLIDASGHVRRIVDLADLEREPDIPES
jgi:Ala-tRNA(Pro) deacylase